ncbi:MAG: hypothetical protein J6S92_05905 [Oscillospiraceae bacterium]|nr:hypothetical protein [Oscillospiraceae bacterium]MBP0987796.1 hypothetical protein [Oscillospiraceae bacterium]
MLLLQLTDSLSLDGQQLTQAVDFFLLRCTQLSCERMLFTILSPELSHPCRLLLSPDFRRAPLAVFRADKAVPVIC